ncbi:transaldolase [Metallibacterium scheffleri]
MNNKMSTALAQAGQSFWLDNITRALLRGGGLAAYLKDAGISGLTSNPTIFEHAIRNSSDYDAAIRAAGDSSAEAVFFDLALDDLRAAADVFAPVYARTGGADGWVSLEVSPLLADDAAATVAQAVQLHERAARPNLFIKVPGTPAGVEAIETLIHRGVPVNVTLLFDARQYRAAAAAYLRGLERRMDAGLSLDVASVASVFISRWDVKVAGKVPAEMRNKLGLAVAAQIYRDYRDVLASARMQRLMNRGARPQRLLWASTGSKDPKASDTLYVDNLIAPLTINTMPEKTLQAALDHGRLDTPMATHGDAYAPLLARFAELGFEVEAVANTLQKEGAAAFVASWHSLLDSITQRKGKAA